MTGLADEDELSAPAVLLDQPEARAFLRLSC